MSIADDPSQWSSKPKDNVMGKYVRVPTAHDYHILRSALREIRALSTSPTIREECEKALNATPESAP